MSKSLAGLLAFLALGSIAQAQHLSSSGSMIPTSPVLQTGAGVAAALNAPVNSGGGLVTSPVGGANLASGAAAQNIGFTPLNPGANLADLVSPAAAATNLGVVPVATLEAQAVSPRCVADGVTDCLPAFNAAMSGLRYGGGVYGGHIQLGPGIYFVSGSVNTFGRNGLSIAGMGWESTTVKGGTTYPVFTDQGSKTSGTGAVTISDMMVQCGGSGGATTPNANANGIDWNYSAYGSIRNVWFQACHMDIHMANAWKVAIDHVRGNQPTTSAMSSNYGLYMDVADPSNPTINNAIVGNDMFFINTAINAFRLVNFQGSQIVNSEGDGSGGDNWYLCDPPTGTAPCQWGHFTNILSDSPLNTYKPQAQVSGFRIVQGNASAMGQIWITNGWAGNIHGQYSGTAANAAAAVEVQGGDSLNIDMREIVSVNAGIHVLNTTNSNFAAHIVGYNRDNVGARAFLFEGLGGTASGNTFTAQGAMAPSTGSPATAYNGYDESGATQSNLAYGLGQASCLMGLTFGGSFNGTISAQTCTYEVNGQTVDVQDLVTLSSKGSTTGPALLTGLPFSVQGGAYGGISECMGGDGSGAHKMSGLGSAIFAQPGPNSTNVNLYTQGATDVGTLRDTNFTDTTTLTCQLVFRKR